MNKTTVNNNKRHLLGLPRGRLYYKAPLGLTSSSWQVNQADSIMIDPKGWVIAKGPSWKGLLCPDCLPPPSGKPRCTGRSSSAGAAAGYSWLPLASRCGFPSLSAQLATETQRMEKVHLPHSVRMEAGLEGRLLGTPLPLPAWSSTTDLKAWLVSHLWGVCVSPETSPSGCEPAESPPSPQLPSRCQAGLLPRPSALCPLENIRAGSIIESCK